MKLINLFVIILLLICCSSYSQETVSYHRVKKNPGKVTITPYSNSEIVILRISGLFENARKVVYLDTLNGFQAVVPKSLEIQETNHLYNFCMTIPRENGRDNAICINSASKSDYETFEKFRNHIINDPKYFDENPISWLWGNESYLISANQEKYETYESYKAKIRVKDRYVLGQFIIIETVKSYLWINYVADEETFDSDLKHFSEFLKKFEILNEK